MRVQQHKWCLIAGALALTAGCGIESVETPDGGSGEASALAEGVPDFSGFWGAEFSQDDSHYRRLGPGSGPTPGDFRGLYFTDTGRARAEAWTPDVEYLPENIGLSQVVPAIMTSPFPYQFIQEDDQLTIKITECDNVRTIYLDGRGHPPADAPRSAMGHSIGHWEGQTLVVDTTHIREGYVRPNGAPQSANAHLIERISFDGEYLIVITILNDPEYYTRPPTRVLVFLSRPELTELETYGSCA